MRGKPAIRAIFKRDLSSWFSSPTGYVFITVFVLLCAFAQFIPPRFFQENTAGLASLADWFKYLLLFFVPAITMLVWAGERSRGTDEILLTLPASDLKIVLGKFMAASGIYTVSLLFSFLLPVWLELLGDPDWGLVFSGYLAFWCLGLLLISVGMVGSQLTDNLTIAFILGAVFCAILVFAETFLGLLFPTVWRNWSGYGPIGFFEEMVRGLVTLKSLVFFAGAIAALLYLNLILLARGRRQGTHQATHLSVRFAALLVGFLALTVLVGRWGPRADLTSESLHSLSDETLVVIDGLEDERPVTIRAWVSPDVPRDYVPTRRDLIDLLREYDARGGEAVSVEVIETERFSDAARNAEANFGIRHRTVYAEDAGRRREFDIYLGVAVTCGAEEAVVPFLDKGLSVEYELTRSVRVAAGVEKAKVGVLDNHVKMFGGMDYQTFERREDWEIVRELRLQYDVVVVSPDEAYPDDLDVLLVAMPSSLTQPQMDRLAVAMATGTPALLFDDPFPNVASHLRPDAPLPGGRRNPMTGQMEGPAEQKGDIRGFLREFRIDWSPSLVAWDQYSPHPDVPEMPEWVFVGASSGSLEAFNSDEATTSGLQELLIWFGGAVREARGTAVVGAAARAVQDWAMGLPRWMREGPLGMKGLQFVPLLRSSRDSGLVSEGNLFRRDMFGRMELNPSRVHFANADELVLACRVTGFTEVALAEIARLEEAAKKKAAEKKGAEGEEEAEAPAPPGPRPVDLIFVADLDMMNLPFLWQFRREGEEEFRFDNVTFVLNCVDALVGETSFVDLRKRRPRDRTLTTIEEQEAEFRRAWLKEKTSAESSAEIQLKAAQDRLDTRVKEIEELQGLDERAKAIRIESVRQTEQRRFEAASQAIEDEKQGQIDRARGTMNDRIAAIQNKYRFLAVGISPLPAVLIGFLIFFLRWRREQIAVPEIRSIRGGV